MATLSPIPPVFPSSMRTLVTDVGLDDHWQNCTRTCANGTVIPSWDMNNGFGYKDCSNNTGSTVIPWYNSDGVPQIDLHRFPDLKG